MGQQKNRARSGLWTLHCAALHFPAAPARPFSRSLSRETWRRGGRAQPALPVPVTTWRQCGWRWHHVVHQGEKYPLHSPSQEAESFTGLAVGLYQQHKGGKHRAEPWAYIVPQRQLWREGSCEVGPQSEDQFCSLMGWTSRLDDSILP
ncbi:uncharacterized protein LOC107054741 [Gallus gallus]|uniref:uncharacterized protein LOC107054741 n=1 Tax=Gallus gallus TaxID=9031 RepID=UPI001AE58D05|nr:uncharacterized protein LOC107054741 [Gallus gallus]